MFTCTQDTALNPEESKGQNEARLPAILQVGDEAEKNSFCYYDCDFTVIPWQWSPEEKQASVIKKKETGLR